MSTKTTENFKYRNSLEEITVLINSRHPLIWVTTHEENRFIEDYMKVLAPKCHSRTWIWSNSQGLHDLKDEIPHQVNHSGGGRAVNFLADLETIVDIKPEEYETFDACCFIMRDMHIILGPNQVRRLRDLIPTLQAQGKTLIVTSPSLAHGAGGLTSGLPPTLERDITVVNYELPTQAEIETQMLEDLVTMQDLKLEAKVEYDPEEIKTFSKALCGLTMAEAQNAWGNSIVHKREILLKKLINEKQQIIRKSDVLEFVETQTQIDDIGGLDNIKDYILKYASASTDEALKFGVEPLRGIIITGVPGTGKSELAKAVGNIWGVPLVRLDVARVMTGLVGGSEAKMRDVLETLKALSPAVLWVDEVDKSLSGTKSSNFSDGGTLARVFGTLLHAMQEGMAGITFVATANDITMLPPEFIRRFNEVFFVDLPTEDERWEILGIHLTKRGRSIETFTEQRTKILKASEKFTGAEIEKAVKDAIASAFHRQDTDVGVKHLLNAFKDTKPIAHVMKEKIDQIRKTAETHYRLASRSPVKEKKTTAKFLKKKAPKKRIIVDDVDEEMLESLN